MGEYLWACVCYRDISLPFQSYPMSLIFACFHGGLKFFPFEYSPRNDLVELGKQLPVPLNSFVAGPQQAAPAFSSQESRQVTVSRPSQERGCLEAPVSTRGGDPAVLTGPAPRSAHTGYTFLALPMVHPGVLVSSLAGNPCRAGAVWG